MMVLIGSNRPAGVIQAKYLNASNAAGAEVQAACGEWLMFGQRGRTVLDSLCPQCAHHQTLACLGNANGCFGDVSRPDPTRFGQSSYPMRTPDLPSMADVQATIQLWSCCQLAVIGWADTCSFVFNPPLAPFSGRTSGCLRNAGCARGLRGGRGFRQKGFGHPQYVRQCVGGFRCRRFRARVGTWPRKLGRGRDESFYGVSRYLQHIAPPQSNARLFAI